MTKYLPIIKRINHYLEEFNSFLQPEYAFQLLDENELNNDNYFLNLSGKGWDDFSFPRNREVGGIYFYFAASESGNQDIAVYIGKASLNSNIGRRLWSHFRNRFEENNMIEFYNQEAFKIELITSIPIENIQMTFFAPALEEFLISKIQSENCRLFNRQGNYQ